jgi:hypothetical protein
MGLGCGVGGGQRDHARRVQVRRSWPGAIGQMRARLGQQLEGLVCAAGTPQRRRGRPRGGGQQHRPTRAPRRSASGSRELSCRVDAALLDRQLRGEHQHSGGPARPHRADRHSLARTGQQYRQRSLQLAVVTAANTRCAAATSPPRKPGNSSAHATAGRPAQAVTHATSPAPSTLLRSIRRSLTSAQLCRFTTPSRNARAAPGARNRAHGLPATARPAAAGGTPWQAERLRPARPAPVGPLELARHRQQKGAGGSQSAVRRPAQRCD